jgi:polysaccharide pyruvyl transferase WcaK-like protein
MNRSESVTVRDQNSVEVLKEVGVDATLVDDAAIFLEPNLETGQDLLQSQGFSPDQPTVGIAGRRVLNETNNNRLWQAYNDFAEELEKRGYQLAFIPFCRHSYEKTGMDHQVCSQLAEEHDESKVLDYTHPDDLIDMISAMNGIIATRLHSMIFAYLSDTPFVAVEYADKVSSLLDQYGKRDQGISLEAVSGDRILEIFDEALDQQ